MNSIMLEEPWRYTSDERAMIEECIRANQHADSSHQTNVTSSSDELQVHDSVYSPKRIAEASQNMPDVIP